MKISQILMSLIINIMKFHKDPIGKAIHGYSKNQKDLDIIVKSDICEDDIIPLEVLFRSFKEMPEIEKKALSRVKGKTLDVGACAGPHSIELINRGHKNIHAIDISKGSVEYLKNKNISAEHSSFLNHKQTTYDTILMLMNGIGVAGKLSNLKKTLQHANSLLNKDGILLCDSSDIKYLYEEDDGSLWIDLNEEYYGNFRFQMEYKNEKSSWFDWLYVDYDNLHKTAKQAGFKCQKITEENEHYLAELTKI